MASDDTDDRAPSDIVREGIDQIDSGTQIGEKIVLSRRHAVMLATGTLSLGALAGVGSQEASAQAAGQVGTSSEPIDVFANLINGNGPVTDGDGTERDIYVIANGASDPADAGADDIIFEEQ